MTNPQPQYQPTPPQPPAPAQQAPTPPPGAAMPAAATTAPALTHEQYAAAQQQAAAEAAPAPQPPNGVSYADQVAGETQEMPPPPGSELLGDPKRLRYGARAKLMRTVKPLYEQFRGLQVNERGEMELDESDVSGNLDRVVQVYELAEQVQEALGQIAIDADAFDTWCAEHDIAELMQLFQYAVQGLAMGKSLPSPTSSTEPGPPSAPM